MTSKPIEKKKRIYGQKRPLNVREVQAISTRLFSRKEWRDLALFRLGIDSMLRASDLVRIYVDEVVDHNGALVARCEISMKKTNKPVKITLGRETQEALRIWLAARPVFAGRWLFPGRKPGEHISEIQYRRRAKDWFKDAGLDLRFYSTHSLRRTKPTEIYRQTNNIEAVRRLLGHQNVYVTSKYLGVQDEDALNLADRVQI